MLSSEADTSGCCTATTGIGNAIINNEIKITDNDNDATNATGDNEENAFASNKFCIDYSKRGTANCKICKKNSVKDDLRIYGLSTSNVRLNRFSELRYHQIL